MPYNFLKGGADLIKLLASVFIKNPNAFGEPETRKGYGILCGTVGIFLNVALFAAKFVAGLLSGSIAVTADAFNNLSDAGSSVITMIGFKMAGQKPDTDHPFGHGRIEYISGLIVSMIIILMGSELLKSSIDKILSPESSDYGAVTLVILCVSIAVKLYMYFYNSRTAKKIRSAAMAATAADSLSDCVATSAVLVSVIISSVFAVDIDGWCGLAVAIFIMIAGLRAAKDTVSPLLGQKPEKEFVESIEKTVLARPEILGIHDLIVHDYGPGRVMISLHAEVSDRENVTKIHEIIDETEKELSQKLDCHAVIHMDPISADDEEVLSLKEKVGAIITETDPELSFHDFRIVKGEKHTNIIFDLVVPYSKDMRVKDEIAEKIHALDDGFTAVIEIDNDYVL